MQTQKTIRAAVIQHANTKDKKQNLAESLHWIEQAAKAGAQLVLLQELHGTLYFCQEESWDAFELAEPIDGLTVQTLKQCAQDHQIVLVGSFFEKRAPGIYHNTAVVIEKNGELAGIYRKMHIPDDPGFYEKFYFTPGDARSHTFPKAGFTPIQTHLGKLGVLICWDQWYPEAARLMALNGAELLLYPTAIGWNPADDLAEKTRQREAWITIQRSHAIANHLPVLVANRVGIETAPTLNTETHFWGNSFISGTQGEILTSANTSTPQFISADIDLTQTDRQRTIWPFFRDRRIDAYGGLLNRYSQ